MEQIHRIPVLIAVTFGLALAADRARGEDPPPTCMSIGGGGTQFSSTCHSCVVTDGPATIDRDESTYGALEIVTAGSGTMRATAPSGVVFPAGSSAAILQSIDFYGAVEMSLRTYEGDVLQEEFVINLEELPASGEGPGLVAFRTTRQYDAVEFTVSQLDPNTTPPQPGCGYGNPLTCQPSPHRVTARIHEFCSGPDMTPDAFAFSEQAGVEPGMLVTSAPVTITGIEAPVAISAENGWYSVGCTETYVAAAGSISNGQTVCVRHWAAWEFGGGNSTSLTVGGVSGWFTSRTRAADGTPGAFTFSDQAGVEPGAQVTSAPVTISGIEKAVPVFVSDGTYSIGCTASYTAAEGSISDGQTVCVRHTAAGFGGSASTTLTVGNVSDTFTSTTRAADVTPAAFSFTDQGGVDPGVTVTSAAVTITGIEAPAPISVSGGEYSIGCTATFTPASGTIANDQAVCVRHTAGSFGTTTTTTLTVGGVADAFSSTVRAADTTPDAFSFVDQDGVAIGTTITSESVTIGGIEQAVPISIAGGAYSIGCGGTFTSTAGSIASGQTVCVRHTAAGTHGTATDTTLTVGGISDTFSSTTAAAPAAPAQGGGGGAPSPWLLGVLAAVATLRRGRSGIGLPYKAAEGGLYGTDLPAPGFDLHDARACVRGRMRRRRRSDASLHVHRRRGDAVLLHRWRHRRSRDD